MDENITSSDIEINYSELSYKEQVLMTIRAYDRKYMILKEANDIMPVFGEEINKIKISLCRLNAELALLEQGLIQPL